MFCGLSPSLSKKSLNRALIRRLVVGNMTVVCCWPVSDESGDAVSSARAVAGIVLL